MTLEKLNLVESGLMSEIRKTSCFIEEKLEQLEEFGIFEKYSKVFKEYSELINSKNEGAEALKRSVFLYWYQSAEPSFLSGIDILPEKEGRKVLELLNNKTKKKDLDDEFQWMLSHYIQVVDFVFDDFPNIKNFPVIENKEIWESADYDLTKFENRGQMGNYWTSVISSNIKRLNFQKKLKQKNDRKNTEK